MSDQSGPSVAMLGFQSTGKSTYLGAFFIACEEEQEDMAITTFSDGDRDYLNGLADELADCKNLGRTHQTDPGRLDLRVRLSKTGEPQRVVVPDLSGELLRDSMNVRVLAPELEALLAETDTVLLFLRIDEVLPVNRLTDFAAAMKAAGEEVTGEAASEEDTDWRIELAPTQARLTDVVQELLRLKGRDALRVGVVISAWDKRPPGSQSPQQWAEQELALVLQTLRSSGIDWVLFGVSAQGGDFDDEADRKRLENTRLAERAIVESADGQAAGIGAPLRWALRP